jgi:hypothetical protein
MASSATNTCASIISDPAPGLVMDAWSTFRGFAYQGIDLAHQQIESLNGFNMEFHQWDASWQADDTLSGFLRPIKPTLPDIAPVDLSALVPEAPSLNIARIATESAPPEPTALRNPPSFNLRVNAPDPVGDGPGDAPTLNIPDAPEVPELAFPADTPTLDTITIEDAPTLEITAFAEAAPEFDTPAPGTTIDYQAAAYASALLDKLKTQISTMLDGGTGYPAWVDALLFGQANDRDDQTMLSAERSAAQDFAGRGFDAEPNGFLRRALDQVRRDNRDARAATGREIWLKKSEQEQKNIQFAVTSGISLEVSLLQAHLQVEERKFQYAVKLADLRIAVFNAVVTGFNARVAAFNARVEAYQAFLDGQRARADLHKTLVEAAKVRGEINEQRVRIYESQIRAEAAKADAARTLIEAFRARIDAERARIEGYRAEVDAFTARVGAYRAEWDGERARLEAEAVKGRVYESVVNAYGQRVQVWRTKSEVRIEEHRASLLSAQALLQRHDAQTRTLLAKLEAVNTYVRAQQAQGEQLARMYEGEARVEGAAVDADNRAFTAQTERERARIDVLLNDARLQIEQASSQRSLLLRAMETAAQAASQLAASAFSAVSFSAGVSSGHSRSEGCDTNFNYNIDQSEEETS